MTTSASAISNQTNLDIYADVEVFLGTASPSSGAYVSLYLMEAVDGSNYPTPSDADCRLATTQLWVVIPIGTTSATPQRVVARNLVMPPGTFKVRLDNQIGTTMAASGNTVKLAVYDVNLNG